MCITSLSKRILTLLTATIGDMGYKQAEKGKTRGAERVQDVLNTYEKLRAKISVIKARRLDKRTTGVCETVETGEIQGL